MKIKLLTPRSGPKGSLNVGDEIEVSEPEGKRLIEAGKASPVSDRKPKRTATAKKHETPED